MAAAVQHLDLAAQLLLEVTPPVTHQPVLEERQGFRDAETDHGERFGLCTGVEEGAVEQKKEDYSHGDGCDLDRPPMKKMGPTKKAGLCFTVRQVHCVSGSDTNRPAGGTRGLQSKQQV